MIKFIKKTNHSVHVLDSDDNIVRVYNESQNVFKHTTEDTVVISKNSNRNAISNAYVFGLSDVDVANCSPVITYTSTPSLNELIDALSEDFFNTNFSTASGGSGADQTRLDLWHDRVQEQVINGGGFNVFIVGDSLIDSVFVDPDPSEIPLFNYYREIFKNFNMNSIESAAAGMTSTQWLSSSNPSPRARYNYVSPRVIGDEGYDSAVFYFLGTNDYSLHSGNKALIKADIQASITQVLSDHPKIWFNLVSPPWSNQDRTDLLREIGAELGQENPIAYIDGALGTIGVSERYPNNFHTNDQTHINRNGGRRTANWVMYNAIPSRLHPLIDYPEYSTVEPATARTNRGVVRNGQRWFYNGAAVISQSIGGYTSFDDITVIGNELMYIVHDGNSRAVYFETSDGTILDQYGEAASAISPTFDLRDLFENEEGWVVQVPSEATRMYVNIRTTGAPSVTEFLGSMTRPTDYKMAQVDLIQGLPIQL